VSSARRRQQQARRNDILMAASTLISQHGLGGLSMRMLAREVGLTAPTLYGYFSSKDAVVQALTADRVAIMRDYLQQEVADAEPGMPSLLAIVRGYRRLALNSADFYHMIIERTGPLAEGLAVGDGAQGIDLIRTVAVDVQVAIDRGELAPVDPEQTILALWVTAHGYVSLELAGSPPIMAHSEEDREQTYLQYIRAMLRGLEATAHVAVSATQG
jgi:AcrR family transcriptional regulator